MRLYLLLWTLLILPLQAENFEVDRYRTYSQQALQMSQYHPDKAKLMNEKIALKLESEYSNPKDMPSHLAYNLGNLWYHAGDLGKSMLWYRRAENKTPHSKMLKHNMNIVMNERLDELPNHFRPKWLPYGDVIILFEPIFFWAFFIALSFLLYSSGKALRGSDQGLKVKLITTAVLASLWIAVTWLSNQRGQGVVLESEVIARKGNGLIFAPAFTHPLHEGTEVIKLEQRQNWVYVQLSNGQRCWLPERSLGWIH